VSEKENERKGRKPRLISVHNTIQRHEHI